jgi:hypothetical protein
MIVITTIVVAVIGLALIVSIPVIAYALSPYQSGYEHGISDAKKLIQGHKDLYILQPGKGWTDHTGQFIQGYVVGLNSTSRQDINM